MFDGDALTAEEVAEMLRVSKNSVYRLAQSGELASYRARRKLRFTLRDVEAYTRSGMRSQKGAQTAQSPSTPSRTAEAGPPSGAREGMRRRGDRRRAFGEGAARPRLRPPANRIARYRRREEPTHRTACAGNSQDYGKRVLPRRDRRNRGLRGGEHGSHHLRELDERRGLQDAGEETHFFDVRICR